MYLRQRFFAGVTCGAKKRQNFRIGGSAGLAPVWLTFSGPDVNIATFVVIAVSSQDFL